MRLLILALLVAASGCKGDGSESKSDKTGSGDKATGADKTGDKTGADQTGDQTGGDKTGDKTGAPEPALLDEPVRRRLHVDRAEASSFLWNDWNRFQENYHPLYVADDDPKTAWVEGADGSGAGQWLRLHLTEARATTAVALKLKNGYHKSKSLFDKNARAKVLEVVLLPSNVKKKVELPDTMDVASFEVEQPSGPLSAIELRVVEVYEGSKYADLCLSDVEIYATSRTPENPAFEKAKLDRVNAWKKERLAAAALFASAEGKAMPVGTSYRVVDAKKVGDSRSADDPIADAAAMATAARAHLGSDHAAALERAHAALEARFADWKATSAAVKKGRKVPAIDGLHVPEVWDLMGGGSRDDSYALPLPGLVEFLTSSRISLFESTEKVSVADALAGKPRPCRRGEDTSKHYYYRPPEGGGGVTNELLVIQCGMVEERDGYYPYVAFQLIEYDDSGKINAIVSPDSVTSFSWSDGGDRLGSGKRLRRENRRLVSDALVARK